MPRPENSKGIPKNGSDLDLDDDDEDEEEEEKEEEEKNRADVKGKGEKPKAFKCQICDSKVPEDATHCPVCGTKFISPEEMEGATEMIEDLKGPLHKRKEKKKEEQIPVVLDAEIEEEILEERRKPKGRAVPPIAKSKAKEEERARPKATKRVAKEVKSPVWINLILVALVVMMLLIAYFYIAVYLPSLKMKVDGDFSDWGRVKKTTDGIDAGTHVNMDIWKYAIVTQDEDMFIYLEVAGTMLNGDSGVDDAVNMFIDNDNNPDTGYRVKGVGAEFRIEIIGKEGSVASSKLYHFDATTKRSDYDWSAWKASGDVKAAARSARLECKVAMADINIGKGDPMAVLFAIKSGDAIDYSKYTLSFAGMSVRVVQRFVAPETVPQAATGVNVLSLTVDAAGKDNTITAIKLHQTTPSIYQFDLKTVSIRSGSATGPALATSGTISPDGIVELQLNPAQEIRDGTQANYFIVVDVSNVTASPIIGLALLSTSDVSIKDGTVTIQNEYPSDGFVRSYVGAIPARIDIDGAFGDWKTANETTTWTDTDPSPVATDALDIQKVSERRRGEMGLDLLVSVDDRILDGASVPEQWVAGSDLPMKGDDGMDTVAVYIDANDNVTSGKIIGGIGADCAIFVKGMNGKIVSAVLAEWNPGTADWGEEKDITTVASGPMNIELTLDLSEIKHLMRFSAPTDPAPMKIVVATEAWNGQMDTSGPYTVDL